MEILEIETERTLSREDAAAWLQELAHQLSRNNQLQLRKDGLKYTVRVPGEVTMEADIQEIRPMDDAAYVRVASTTRIDGAVVNRDIDTALWVETPDGWKVARDTWTSAPESP